MEESLQLDWEGGGVGVGVVTNVTSKHHPVMQALIKKNFKCW